MGVIWRMSRRTRMVARMIAGVIVVMRMKRRKEEGGMREAFEALRA